MMMKISVITICYNAAKTIEGTINSVIHQDYPELEYILIDGGSTDGTIEIINKYRDKISYFVSEPDKGISDAFNKGIKASTGEIIGIINAFNLIDGMDGLCGGISCMIVFTLSVIYSLSATHAATMCLILACALIGFLLYNKPKAKIFMGDGGSQFLGFMIATLPLYRTTENFEYNKFFIMIVLVSIPLMDCIAAIWRRTREHRSIMSADRAHLHHKLLYLGLTVKQALSLVLLLQFCLCIISCIAMYLRGYNAVVLMLTALLFMTIIFSMIHFFYRKRIAEKGDKDF